jgi:DNA repair protein RadC
MHIRDLPDDERPREKLLRRGREALSDAEVLALLLGSGPRGCSVVEHAQRLLKTAGGLRGLLDCDTDALLALPGLGPARAGVLHAALELGRRHLAARLQRGELLDQPWLAGEYVTRRLRHAGRERFVCLLLDTRHRVLHECVLFEGSLDRAEVHPREVVQLALRWRAAAVMLAHNHPSGDTTPSAADLAVTRRLRDALALVDVRLLDHLIVGDGPACSLAEGGWLR